MDEAKKSPGNRSAGSMPTVIHFGKYRGQPVDVLRADPEYAEWLKGQSWFVEKYRPIMNVIVNNFCEPSETPVHNALQAKFLDKEFLDAVGCAVIERHPDYPGFIVGNVKNYGEIEFEHCGFDVRVRNLVFHGAHARGTCVFEYLARIVEANAESLVDEAKSTWRLAKELGCFSFPLGDDGRLACQSNRPLPQWVLQWFGKWWASHQDLIAEEEGLKTHQEWWRRELLVRLMTETGEEPPVTAIEQALQEADAAREACRDAESLVGDLKLDMMIEIKPSLGDDYPAVLRSMKAASARSRYEGCGTKVLLADSYAGVGATLDQVREIFGASGILVVTCDDIARHRRSAS